MNKNDITYALFSSTKGHFDRHDIYQRTVDNILAHLPAEIWGELIAHIKISDMPIFEEMTRFLEPKGFRILGTTGAWQHGQDSHQKEYLKDMIKTVDLIKTDYLFFAEDDWLIQVDNAQFIYWLHFSQKLLENNPDILQIRIPRFGNEFQRINLLKKKHQIDTRAIWVDDNYFRHSDFSNNPHLCRTRDFRAALTLVSLGAFEPHSENGLGKALKLFGHCELPLVCLNPAKIHCAHVGTKIGEEDDPNNIAMEKLIN